MTLPVLTDEDLAGGSPRCVSRRSNSCGFCVGSRPVRRGRSSIFGNERYGRDWVVQPLDRYLRDDFDIRYWRVQSHSSMRLTVQHWIGQMEPVGVPARILGGDEPDAASHLCRGRVQPATDGAIQQIRPGSPGHAELVHGVQRHPLDRETVRPTNRRAPYPLTTSRSSASGTSTSSPSGICNTMSGPARPTASATGRRNSSRRY